MGGDFTVNNTAANSARFEELHLLYEKLKQKSGGEDSGGSFCQKLEHFMSAKTNGDIRGLEEKLKAGNRLDQLNYALDLKERATKAIMRQQASRTAQRIYTILLDELHTKFCLAIAPLIQEDASRVSVDQQILVILEEIQSSLGENLLEVDASDLLAFLFFLGGNCHIRWDKC